MAENEQAFLTTEDLAERYRTTCRAIRGWRIAGTGPKGVKFAARVLYPRAAVEAWEAETFGTGQHDQGQARSA